MNELTGVKVELLDFAIEKMGEARELFTQNDNKHAIDKLIEELEDRIHEIDAKRVSLDTLATLFQRFPDPIERRTAIIDLFEALSELEITTILTMELPHLTLDRKVTIEEYLAHGVLIMHTLFSQGVTSRALQVEKMRGIKINPNLVPYTIDTTGIEVYPEVKLFSKR